MWFSRMRGHVLSTTMGTMNVFVVERFLVGWPWEEVQRLLNSLDEVAPTLALWGVHHIESIHIPLDETCFSVFTGPGADEVRAANGYCDLPVGRVLAAVTHHS